MGKLALLAFVATVTVWFANEVTTEILNNLRGVF